MALKTQKSPKNAHLLSISYQNLQECNPIPLLPMSHRPLEAGVLTGLSLSSLSCGIISFKRDLTSSHISVILGMLVRAYEFDV